MKNSIKSKLFVGIGLLAAFVILLWISGLIFINTLAENSGAIIQDNIRSVSYAQQMEQMLSDLYTTQVSAISGTNAFDILEDDSYQEAVQRIQSVLDQQKENITETGEQELTHHLQTNYNSFLTIFETAVASSEDAMTLLNQQLSPAFHRLQQNLSQLTTMNIDAIHRKNSIAQKTAANVIFYMSVIGALCSVLGILMLLRFPGYIVNPIRELIQRIKEISNRNYNQELDFHTGDEYEELATAFNRMAGKLQEYENSSLNRIMSEKKRVETIINNMRDAVIGLDADKYILFANDKSLELIGKSKEQLVGKYAPDVASENDLFHKVMQSLSGEKDKELGYINTEDSNDEHYYSVEVVPVQYEGDGEKDRNAHLGNIITLKNVTRFHELDQAKTNFISVVSHELKTPISSINMSLRLLGDERVGQLNEEQGELVSNIEKDVRRMKQTTSDLLDLSKIESGNIQLNTKKVKPAELLEYAYETMILQVSHKGLSMDLHVADGLTNIDADAQKTVWVLVNLISNAIRYTKSGGKIELEASEAEDPKFVQFAIKDTGTGIASTDLEKIFDKYYRIEKDHKGWTGTGLGLSISKEFITAQGGTIWAESKPGEGSIFYFLLPKSRR